IMIVYVPILTLQGIEGKMFRPMAFTVIFALATSLVLALTLMPAMASFVFRRGVSEKETRIIQAAKRIYVPALTWAMQHRWATAIATMTFLVGSLAVAPFLGAEFVPRLDEGAIALQAIRPPSVALKEATAATTRLERALHDNFPDEIETVVSRTGRAEIATDPMGVETSDIYLILRPPDQWTRAESKEELVQRISEMLEAEVPGQNYSFSQPIELRTNELISGARSDVAIKIYGEDLATLARLGDEVARVVRQVPGAADVNVEQLAGLPSLRVRVDRAAVARYGVNVADVLAAVSAIGGHPVGEVLEGQRRYTLQVRFAPDARRDLEAIRDIPIAAPGGTPIPLGQLADLDFEEGPAQISRENVQRRMTIQVNVRGRDLAGFVAEARERIAREVAMPSGYFVDWGGQFENLAEASVRLAIAVPAALIMIFMLLFMTYGSARPALVIYLNVPFAATGGILALALRGLPFSISAGIGFIALFGIAVLNGVVMVSRIRRLQATGLSLPEAAREGAISRLRPVLMTALVASLGFAPMALSTSAGAEVQRPLATVVIGGLFTATLLTLLVLPAVYGRFGGNVAENREVAA
ncbi:MAG: efflux RND transporter permease subunit, partial [Deltaproteobacteria bacterium]